MANRRILVTCVLLPLLLAFVDARSKLPKDYWTAVGKPVGNEQVTFMIALEQQNIKLLEQIALEVSDPTSSKYGQFLSKQEIIDLVAPPLSISESVKSHILKRCPGSQVDNLRDALSVRASVSCIEAMFGIQMSVYQHNDKQDAFLIRRHSTSAEVSFPEEIAEHIEFITGLSEFPFPQKPKKVAPIDAVADDPVFNYIIPQTVRRIYSIPVGSQITNPMNSQGVIEFTPYGAPFFTDMTSFAQNADETFTNFTHIVGPFSEDGEGESTLDAQYQISLAPNSKNQYYITVNGWIYEMAVLLFSMETTPYVNSISYGWMESLSCESDITGADCDGYTSQTYNARADAELAKIAANGISVITCSQDEGAPSDENIDCSLDGTDKPIWPIYPAASPWVTTVSATTLVGTSSQSSDVALPPICNMGYTCDTSSTMEVPCEVNNTYYQWTTGGGFSNYTARPSWQDSAVTTYLASKAMIPPSEYFHSENRGYPDVSAVGSRILIWDDGSISVTAGTSASTPIFSAVVALLNDYRLNNGKKPLGFLNPMLYQMAVKSPNTFHDITTGANNCAGEGSCCEYGYGATVGWDPVTGWGTPNFANMLNYIKQLP